MNSIIILLLLLAMFLTFSKSEYMKAEEEAMEKVAEKDEIIKRQDAKLRNMTNLFDVMNRQKAKREAAATAAPKMRESSVESMVPGTGAGMPGFAFDP